MKFMGFILDRPARSVHLDFAGLFYFVGEGEEVNRLGTKSEWT